MPTDDGYSSPFPLRDTSPDPEAALVDSLNADEASKLQDLELRMAQHPVPLITPHHQEPHKCRLLRFLRNESFDVERALERMHVNAKWWVEYGMEGFAAEDEFDEQGPCFVCGEDRWGRPTLVCRPCVHVVHDEQESLRVAKRAVYTVQRCIERLPTGEEQFNLIYDVGGLKMANMDTTFVRELVGALQNQYPGRIDRIFVINSNCVASALWPIVSAFLDASAKAKIKFCRGDFHQELRAIIPENHPYLRYATEVRKLPAREARSLPLPSASPYRAGWLIARPSKVDRAPSASPPRTGEEGTERALADNRSAKVRVCHALQTLLSSPFFRRFACCQ
jgi:hypothetical protein